MANLVLGGEIRFDSLRNQIFYLHSVNNVLQKRANLGVLT